jgi:fructose-1,6-bisphosphatase I
MRAAGYCIYSSATVLVLTLGEGVYGFTLDPQIDEFVLTHENVTIPQRGTVYSCNEANSEGWKNDGWKEYLRNIKLGLGESQKQYAHRYVGSMVGDIHRTLLYGGIFAYPSCTQKMDGNLQLLYKTSPLAFVIDQAGGKAMDEDGNDLLDKKPERIHQKSPCFMGSPQDMEELQRHLKNLR